MVKTKHIACVILFRYDNEVCVPSRCMSGGVRQAWAGVWFCGAVLSCLLSVTLACCCGSLDILSCLRYGWQLQVYCSGKRDSLCREVLRFLGLCAGVRGYDPVLGR